MTTQGLLNDRRSNKIYSNDDENFVDDAASVSTNPEMSDINDNSVQIKFNGKESTNGSAIHYNHFNGSVHLPNVPLSYTFGSAPGASAKKAFEEMNIFDGARDRHNVPRKRTFWRRNRKRLIGAAVCGCVLLVILIAIGVVVIARGSGSARKVEVPSSVTKDFWGHLMDRGASMEDELAVNTSSQFLERKRGYEQKLREAIRQNLTTTLTTTVEVTGFGDATDRRRRSLGADKKSGYLLVYFHVVYQAASQSMLEQITLNHLITVLQSISTLWLDIRIDTEPETLPDIRTATTASVVEVHTSVVIDDHTAAAPIEHLTSVNPEQSQTSTMLPFENPTIAVSTIQAEIQAVTNASVTILPATEQATTIAGSEVDTTTEMMHQDVTISVDEPTTIIPVEETPVSTITTMEEQLTTIVNSSPLLQETTELMEATTEVLTEQRTTVVAQPSTIVVQPEPTTVIAQPTTLFTQETTMKPSTAAPNVTMPPSPPECKNNSLVCYNGGKCAYSETRKKDFCYCELIRQHLDSLHKQVCQIGSKCQIDCKATAMMPVRLKASANEAELNSPNFDFGATNKVQARYSISAVNSSSSMQQKKVFVRMDLVLSSSSNQTNCNTGDSTIDYVEFTTFEAGGLRRSMRESRKFFHFGKTFLSHSSAITAVSAAITTFFCVLSVTLLFCFKIQSSKGSNIKVT